MSRSSRRPSSVRQPGVAPAREAAPLTTSPPAGWDRLGWSLLLAGMVAVAYLPAIDNGFVNWDDPHNFLVNAEFEGLGPRAVRWALSTYHLGVYQPVAWTVLSAERSLWGLDPRGYHLVSVLLHAANAVLAFRLAYELLKIGPGAASPAGGAAAALGCALATARGALHPQRVEAVAWASSQPYLLCGSFGLLTVLAYLRAADPGREPRSRRRWLAASLGAFALALGSKAIAVGLPVVLLLLDVYPLRRIGPGGWRSEEARAALKEKALFFLMSAAAAVVAVRARSWAGLSADPGHGPLSRLIRCGYVVAFYFSQLLNLPGVSPYYPRYPGPAWNRPLYVLGLGATVALTALAIATRRRAPALLVGWLSFVALLLPTLGLVRSQAKVEAADRYTYLASIALAPLMAVVLAKLLSHPRARGPVAVVALGLLALHAGQTWRLCETWSDSVALWSYAERHGADDVAVVQCNLGLALAQKGRLGEAEENFREAVQIDPGNAWYRNNLGYTLALLGRGEEAVEELSEALRLDPDSPEVHHSLGFALGRVGRTSEAEAHLRESLRLRPGHAATRRDLDALRARTAPSKN